MREQIIDFLRRELVGPDPIPTKMQENGEEILENDSPTVRYGAGATSFDKLLQSRVRSRRGYSSEYFAEVYSSAYIGAFINQST
ncbi:hypothetical protein BH24ACI2_BH24ACI2_15130 [soil metagenome]